MPHAPEPALTLTPAPKPCLTPSVGLDKHIEHIILELLPECKLKEDKINKTFLNKMFVSIIDFWFVKDSKYLKIPLKKFSSNISATSLSVTFDFGAIRIKFFHEVFRFFGRQRVIVLHVKNQNTFTSNSRSTAGDVAMKLDSLMLQLMSFQFS